MVSLSAASEHDAPRQGAGRMRLFAQRRLTEGEARLGRKIFGDAISYRRVRIVQLPPLTFGAVVPFGRTIFYSRWRAARDFSTETIDEQGWFIHELAHVWQAHCGCVLPFAKFGAIGRRAYRVNSALPFTRMNIEAQAEVARLVFLARAGCPDKNAPSPAELERLWTIAPRRRKERAIY